MNHEVTNRVSMGSKIGHEEVQCCILILLPIFVIKVGLHES